MLWIFTYHLIAYTLNFAFPGQASQSGQKGIFLFKKPETFLISKDTNILDTQAIYKALTLNGTPYQLLHSGAIEADISESALILQLTQPQIGDSVKISADIYNTSTKYNYKLPKDLIWNFDTNQKSLHFSRENKDGNLAYKISNNQYEGNNEQLKWYGTYNENLCEKNIFSWKESDFFEIKTHKDTNMVRSENIHILDLESDTNLKCIIAGRGNQISVISQEKIPPFAFSGSIITMRSPKINMQTHIKITTDSILKDISKEKILEKIHISPSISLTSENFKISENTIDILAPFENNTHYKIKLDKMEDIYGRAAFFEYEVSVLDAPSLSIGLQSSGSIFSMNDAIYGQIFSSQVDISSYKIQICKIEPSQYLRIQNTIESQENIENPNYNYISMHSPRSCIQKDIKAHKNQTKIPFRLDDEDSQFFKKGIYMLSFREKSALKNIQNFVKPTFFSISDRVITSFPGDQKWKEFFIYDRKNFQAKPQTQVYLHLYKASNTPSNTPTPPRIIALGISDTDWKLTLSDGVFQQVKQFIWQPHIFSILTLESDSWFGFFQLPSSLFQENEKIIQDTKTKSTTFLYTHQYWSPYNQDFSVYGSTQTGKLFLTDVQWKKIREYPIYPQKDYFFTQKIQFDTKIPKWKYFLWIFSDVDTNKSVLISPQPPVFIGGKKVDTREQMAVDFVLQSNDIDESGIPKNLRSYENVTQKNLWNHTVFQTKIGFEGIIRTSDQATKKPLPYIEYEYQFFEQNEHDTKQKLLMEGKWKTDADGFGYIRSQVNFESYGSKKKYICNLTLYNPLTDEILYKTASYLVIPSTNTSYFRDDTPLQVNLKNTWISSDIPLDWKLYFLNDSKNTQIWSGDYGYNIWLLGGDFTATGSFEKNDFSIDTKSFPAGIYKIQVFPIRKNLPALLREKLTTETLFLKKGEKFTLPKRLELIPQKMQYKQWENVKMMIVSPQNKGGLIINAHQWTRKINTKYLTLSGAVLDFDFPLSADLSEPLCIQIKVFWEQEFSNQKCIFPEIVKENSFEIWLDASTFEPGKQTKITVKTDKNKLHHTAFFLTPIHQSDAFLSWFQSTVNLDAFPDHFEVFSLWDPINFQKTYTGSLSFPKDIYGKYSLIALTFDIAWNTQKKVIPLAFSRPYDLVVSLPKKARLWEKITVAVDTKNMTESIKNMTLVAKIEWYDAIYREKKNLIMNIGSKTTSYFSIPVPRNIKNTMSVWVYLKEWDKIIASSLQDIKILPKVSYKYFPEYTVKFPNIKTNSWVQIPYTSWDQLSLSVGTDIRVLYEPILQSFTLQEGQWENGRLALALAERIQSKIPLSMTGIIIPKKIHSNRFIFSQKDDVSELKMLEYIDSLGMILDLQDSWIQVDKKYADDLKKAIDIYLQTHKNTYLYADAYRIFSHMTGSGADILYKEIDPKKLDRHSRIDYIAGIQNQRKDFTGALLSEAIESVNGTDMTVQRWWSLLSDRALLLQILIRAGKEAKAHKIFREILDEFVKNPRAFSQKEARELLKAVYLQTQLKTKIPAISWSLSSWVIQLQKILNAQNPFYFHRFDTEKIDKNFMISASGKDVQNLIFLFSKKPKNIPQSEYFQISQKVEKVDMSAGVYPDGTFKRLDKMDDNKLLKNALYQVTLEAKYISKNPEEPTKFLMYFPKTSALLTTYQKHVEQGKYTIPFTYFSESSDMYIALYEPSDSSNTWKYTYYIRPRYSWEYILPPVNISLQSNQNIQAQTNSIKFIIP